MTTITVTIEYENPEEAPINFLKDDLREILDGTQGSRSGAVFHSKLISFRQEDENPTEGDAA